MSASDLQKNDASAADGGIDHSSHEEFFEYYKKQSEGEVSRRRFLKLRDLTLAAVELLRGARDVRRLEVADIGCGAGTQAILWATLGHRVHGIDVNEPLVHLARERTTTAGLEGDFRVGTAAALPWPDASMDVCLVPELLEHVEEWRVCLNEFARVLAPGGVLLITTNNKLCPIQYEFNLPLYSWYPARLKHRIERLAMTTRPELANYAKYPAVNWFTFYTLAAELERRGLRPLDRFDVVGGAKLSWPKRMALRFLRASSVLRFTTHVLTPYTVILATRPG